MTKRLVLPDDTQRISIIGQTGTGKTHAALWHLSNRNFHVMPWVIYDYKIDPFINSIEGRTHISVDSVPTKPGLYIVQPEPETDDRMVELQMREIWRRGNTGIYIDEGYMISRKNAAYRAMLTQGRSKRIPMITLMQRPVWVDRFVLSESEFLQVFRLNNQDDIGTVEKYVPNQDLTVRLPPRHSFYYNSPDDVLLVMKPLPDQDVIRASFNARMRLIQRNV